jgi:hypothetical protein
MVTVLGMRGTGSWTTVQTVQSYRAAMLRLYPKGDMRLTGIISQLGSEKIDNWKYDWQSKDFPGQFGSVTAVYTDDALATAYVSGATAGSVLYFKVPLATAYHFRKGHQVLLRMVPSGGVAGDLTLDTIGKVLSVVRNGADSKIVVTLSEADNNSTHTHDLSDCNWIQVVGNVNAQGGAAPAPLSYEPTWYYNLTQIYRTSLWLTRTAMRTRLKGPQAYEEAKREALELHGVEMENSLISSIRTEGTGENGEPENTIMGLLEFIKTYAPDNVDDFTYNTDYSGSTWLEAGEDWLNTFLFKIFQYGDSNERLIICGDGALAGFDKIAMNVGTMSITPETTTYGLDIRTWKHPKGTARLMTHPLFNLGSSADYYRAIVLDPKNIEYKYIDDTTFYPDKGMTEANGPGRIDAKSEEFLTECTYAFMYPKTFGIFDGVGVDNVL